jgi:hypothetical protein
MESILHILNPMSRSTKRTISERYSDLGKGDTVPIPLTEDDKAHFKLEASPYNTYLHVKTDSEKGRDIARAYYLPQYFSHLNAWIEAQNTYVTSLSPREKFILTSYSYRGDRLVNRYLRDERSDVTNLLKAMVGLEDDNGDNNNNNYNNNNAYDNNNNDGNSSSRKSIPFKYQIYDNYKKLARFGIEFPEKKLMRTMNDLVYVQIVKKNLELFANSDVMLILSKAFFEDLMRIFMKAPRLPRPIITYRGVVSETHVKGFDFRSIDFQSTSLNPVTALDFTKQYPFTYSELFKLTDRIEEFTYQRKPFREMDLYTKVDELFNDLQRLQKYGLVNCCIYEITVDTSVPCIYMEGITIVSNEYEVLLPPGINMELGNTIDIRRMISVRDILKEVPVTLENHTKKFLDVYLARANRVLGQRLIGDDGNPISFGTDREWRDLGGIDEQRDFLIKTLKKADKMPPLWKQSLDDRRVAVVQASVSSPYYSKKKSVHRPPFVHNTQLRSALHKTRKVRKGAHSFEAEKRMKRLEAREIRRAKTQRKKERRGSTRRASNAGSYPYKKPSSSTSKSSSKSSSSKTSST